MKKIWDSDKKKVERLLFKTNDVFFRESKDGFHE